MQIYNYDVNGYYVGESVADESPLEPGVYLIPSRATPVAPPPAPAGLTSRWTGDAWVTVIVPISEEAAQEPLRTPEEELDYQRSLMVVSRFQAHAALMQAELLDDVSAYMALPETDRFTKLAWDTVQEFRRTSPLVLSIGALFALNDIHLDDLFGFAKTISV